MMPLYRLAVPALLAAAWPRSACSQAPDSLLSRAPIVRARAPMVRVGEAIGILGAVGLGAALDRSVRSAFQEQRSAFTNDAARVGNSFGTVNTIGPALIGTWVVGRIAGRREVSDAAAWAAGAGAAAGLVTFTLKQAFGRARPPGGVAFQFRPLSGDASFPSGHTSFAFAIASSLAHSTKDRWSDALLYGAAAVTGLSRINDDKHWLSDVIGGAALGILTGRQLHHQRRLRPIAAAGGIGLTLAF